MTASTRAFDWTDLLGQHRTIAIHTPILIWAGDYHAAALFEELVWRWNTGGRESFTVSDAELMAKLYMTRGALRGARARLSELGGIATVKRGLPPVLHYTVKPNAIHGEPDAPIESTLVQNQPNDDAESAQAMAEIEPSSISESVQSYGHTKDSGVSVATAATGESVDTAAPSEDAWMPLKVSIATLATGKPRVRTADGRPLKWIGTIVGDVGRIAGDDPDLALTLWDCFEEALTPDERERFINSGNVGERFGRWSKNGGASTIRAILAQGDGGEA